MVRLLSVRVLPVLVLGSLARGVEAQAGGAPIRFDGTLRQRGTLDWATGRWRQGSGSQLMLAAGGARVVFDNTCTFSGGASFLAGTECWELYEEGRLPTGDVADSFTARIDESLACDCYRLCGFELAYCTDEVTAAAGGSGQIGIQVGLLEGADASGIGGSCMNAGLTLAVPSPPSGAPGGLGRPPANFGGAHDVFVDLSAAGLPGASAAGAPVCWVVTVDLSNAAGGGLTFCGDGGDGVFVGDDTDRFTRYYGLRGTTVLGTVGTGFVTAGDPGVSAGAGVLGVPLESNPLASGADCGTGLASGDFQWINMDGVRVGAPTPSSCLPAGSLQTGGSNCYFFGGWPAGPMADTHLRLFANPGCQTPNLEGLGPFALSYCSAKASSSGCLAVLTASSQGPPFSGARDFSVTASEVQGLRPGLFFGSTSGPAAIVFQGGLLCVQPPTKRSVVGFSFGTASACDGSYALLVNDGNLFPPPFPGGFDAGPGGTSYLQVWYRDPVLNDGFETALSEALQLTWL